MSEQLCVGPHGEGEERTAAPGLAVCRGCESATLQGLRDLPQWWADLADPNRGVRPSQGGKSAEPAPVLGDRPSALRTEIRSTLVGWCLVLRDDRQINLPDEAAVAALTRGLVMQLQELQATAHAAGDQVRARAYSEEITDVRETRASGSDVIGAICEHLRRHAAWLLASEHAELFVEQITSLAGQARRTAHPSRPDGVIQCPCGTRVALDVDRARIVCSGCGEWGDVGWWMDRVGKIPPKPMKITELARWLQEHRDIEISTRQLRRWRDDGVLQAVSGEGAGSAQRFDPVAVALVVRERLDRTTRLSA